MHILPQGQHTEEEINCSISDFISTFEVGNLLRKSDANKQKGFRLLTLAWSDGNSFVPVNSCLLASSKEDNQKVDKKINSS